MDTVVPCSCMTQEDSFYTQANLNWPFNQSSTEYNFKNYIETRKLDVSSSLKRYTEDFFIPTFFSKETK